MRVHARLARYLPRLDDARVSRLARPEHLVAARIEPAFTSQQEFWLDLIFHERGEFLALPFVQIDVAMLLLPESSAFIWPAAFARKERTAPLEDRLEPWLLTVAFQESVAQESLELFTGESIVRERLERAREAAFLGASSAQRFFSAIAPYAYAQRFAKGRSVGIADPLGASGAAMLAADAQVRADLESRERAELARMWFGLDIFDGPDGEADVTIGYAGGSVASIERWSGEGRCVAVADPAFPPVTCSFDPEDGPIVAEYGVRAREPMRRTSAVGDAPLIGGSSGRIALLLREDFARSGGPDVDEAYALAAALERQGFIARLLPPAQCDPRELDLIHAIGARHAQQFLGVARAARQSNVPFVLTPRLDDPENEAGLGAAAVRATSASILDLQASALLETSLARRQLESGDGVRAGHVTVAVDDMRALLALCGAAIFTSDAEREQVAALCGYRGPARVVAGVLAPEPDALPVGSLVGFDPFVLMHGTAEASANHHVLVRAAATLGLPLAIVGSVYEVPLYQFSMAIAGRQTVWLPEASLQPGELAGLYAAARVYADPGWTTASPYRALRAAALGCGLLLSKSVGASPVWTGDAVIVDPAAYADVEAGLRACWEQQPLSGPRIAARTAQLADPLRALQATLGAYAEAAAVRSV